MTTVAHFSDVHAFSMEGVSPFSFVNKRIAGGLNLLLKRRNKHPVRLFEALVDDLNLVKPDQVVVTGDLTNLSLDPEFALARRILDRLDLGPSSVSVIPGNHDVYVWAARLARSYERALGPYATSDGQSEPSFPLVRVRGDLAIIGISTALPSPVPLADGWVGRRQLRAVEEALMLHRNKFRMVLIHHPPVENRMSILRGLRDRGALAGVLARAGAELVLHGHEHRDLTASMDGPDGQVPVMGIGSATYDAPDRDRRARYRLIKIEGAGADRRFTVETRVHDPATGRYTPLA